MSAAIRAEGLTKRYGGRDILKGLTFQVEEGEIFALLGVNGAGKTTALECLEGLRRPDGGTVRITGRTGIQLQSASLPAHIRPMEAVTLFAKWKRAAISPSLLAALGVEELGKKPYASLSTGQQRRLHLALALLGDPEVLFLDEPTAGLDVEGRLALHQLIRRLNGQGKTIVLASHDMAEVESLCSRLAVLKEGDIAFIGSPADMAAQADGRRVIHIRTSLGSETVAAAADVGDTLLTLLQDYRRRGVAVLEVSTSQGTLEEHFLELTGGKSS